MKELVIFGAGAHARKVCNCAIAGGFSVVSFIVPSGEGAGEVLGVPLHDESWLQGYERGINLFVAIGNSETRARLLSSYLNLGWTLPPLIHPSAVVAPDATVGPGVFVGAGAVIESGASISQGAIIDIGVLVDHDVVVPAFVHLRPGTIVSDSGSSPAPRSIGDGTR